MADISKITLPSGTTYDIKDATARQAIADLNNYTAYLGVTTTALTDGATTNPITVSGSSVTAKTGNIVNYGSKEFIFNGSEWQEFGDMSGLKALAFKDTASATYTPAGTVSATFSGTQKYAHITAIKDTTTSTGNFTPSGTVSATFTGTSEDENITVTAPSVLTTVDIAAYSTNGGDDVDITPSGSVGNMSATATASLIIGQPTPHAVTSNGSVPTLTFTVGDTNNETLAISWDAGSMPTLDTSVALSEDNATIVVTPGKFTGTAKYLRITNHRSKLTSTGTFTPTGTVSATFTGTEGSVSVSSKDAVTSLSGNVNNISTGGTVDLNIKPEGTVTNPTFTGTQATITVS